MAARISALREAFVPGFRSARNVVFTDSEKVVDFGPKVRTERPARPH